MFFNYSIDSKPKIKDPDGNTIVDLASKMFKSNSGSIGEGEIKKLTKTYEMRADLISKYEYGTTDGTEMILKYTGVSNPFSLREGDIIVIPNYQVAVEQMKSKDIDDEDNKTNNEILIKNYFKFHSNYKGSTDNYKNITDTKIPNATVQSTPTVPYITEDGQTAVTIRNGRMYFGENNGMSTAALVNGAAMNTSQLNQKIQSLLNNTATAFSGSNCLYNGTSLTDMVRAKNKNS